MNPMPVKNDSERLEKTGFGIVAPGLKALWNPDDENKARRVDFGKKPAGLIMSRR